MPPGCLKYYCNMCLRALIRVIQTPKRRNSRIHSSKTIDIREEILNLMTSTSRSAREAELRLRIAKHLSRRGGTHASMRSNHYILSSVPIIDDNPARFFDFFLPDSFCAACELFSASAAFTSELLLVGVYSVGIAILHGSLLNFKS